MLGPPLPLAPSSTRVPKIAPPSFSSKITTNGSSIAKQATFQSSAAIERRSRIKTRNLSDVSRTQSRILIILPYRRVYDSLPQCQDIASVIVAVEAASRFLIKFLFICNTPFVNMIVSWNWLQQYVLLDMSLEEFERRMTFAGLNHESTKQVGDDFAIDLEVTSNRPDCLGHIGVAREAAVIWQRKLTIPAAVPPEGKTAVEELVSVQVDCPDLCPRYTARVVRGVKVGPSPSWLAQRLETVGIAPINNVVDISNYVLMECGQPLHTFDFGSLRGGKVIVRRPASGEEIEAINHKTYPLRPDVCLICDGESPVGIGGVMGGAGTEISAETRDVLIEAAEFDPISIRNTARLLNLHSDSSYRFERRVDPEGLDWASRRCAELILDLAGGDLAGGVVDVGQKPPPREPITLRYAQLRRILGIEPPVARAREILLALGNEECLGNQSSHSDPRSVDFSIAVIPPSWRRDLTREIDLVEEIGRIHGYDAIPEDESVPMVPSAKRREDRVLEKVRHVLTACGFDEAVTLSVIDRQTSESFSPWTDAAPLRSAAPVVRGADCLRRSLIPSLLAARRANESLGNQKIELFEIAKVYLPQSDALPQEPLMLGIVGGQEYTVVKGVIESLLCELKVVEQVEPDAAAVSQLEAGASCRLRFGGETLGYLGRLTEEAMKRFDLRTPTMVAELRLAPLVAAAELMPRCVEQSPYPAVARDLNLVVAEEVRWVEVAATVRREAGPCLENLLYCDTYRDEKRLGTDHKSLLFSITLRSDRCTLTNREADDIRDRIVAACRAEHEAELRA